MWLLLRVDSVLHVAYILSFERERESCLKPSELGGYAHRPNGCYINISVYKRCS